MAVSTVPTLGELQSLEVELHSPGARGNQKRLSALLHADFLEIGRSGQHYTKADILHSLTVEAGPTAVGSGSFELQVLGQGVALLTYVSWHVLPDGWHARHTQRTSIWQWTDLGWQMRFHQGTPTQSGPPD